MKITGINTIRNGIENGYPFVESILSVLPLVQEYLINDGGSTDGTMEVLTMLASIYPKIVVYSIPDETNVRWDSVSNVLNYFIKEAKGDWIFLGNADELLHEQDIPKIKKFIEETDWPIIRYQRKEVVKKWSRLSTETYHPARTARKVPGLYQNWNSYGGDEFLVKPKHWIDPDRRLKSPFTLYHLYNVFPGNMYNKKRNDAEWLAPGDKGRVRGFKNLSPNYRYKTPTAVYHDLPILARGLVGMEFYEVRDELLASSTE